VRQEAAPAALRGRSARGSNVFAEMLVVFAPPNTLPPPTDSP
jgi:hypothetical protein